METELEYLKSIGVSIIGVAGDDSGDERKARWLIQEKHPRLLISACWGHQVSLTLLRNGSCMLISV